MTIETATEAATDERPGPGHNIAPFMQVPVGSFDVSWEREILEALLDEHFEPFEQRITEIERNCLALPDEIGLDDDRTVNDAGVVINAANELWKALEAERRSKLQALDRIWDCIHGAYKRRQDKIAAGDTEEQKGTRGITVMIPRIKKAVLDQRMKVEARQRAIEEAEARKREEEARRQREEAERLRRQEEEARRAAARKRNEEARAAAEAEARRLEQQRVEAERAAHTAEGEAVQARTVAEAKPAERTRFRTTYGSTMTTQRTWRVDPNSVDVARVNLEALRHYLAVECFVKAGNARYKATGLHDGSDGLRYVPADALRSRT